MATEWISPTWRMPQVNNQSKFENYSLDFDGTEFIDLGSDTTLELTSDFSVSVWIKESGSLNRGIICCGDRNNGSGWHIYRTSTNKVAFNLYTANSRTATSTTSVNTGNWINVIATFEKNGTANQQIKIYVNNTLEDDNGWISAQTPSYSGTIYKQIAYPYAGANEFLGNISTPVVFDYLLSSDQRSYLYNSGAPQNPMAISDPPPIAYYPLGGSSTGSASTLTVPNESVADATVFDSNGTGYIVTKTGAEFDISTKFSFSLWVNPQTIVNYDHLIGASDAGWLEGFGLYMTGGAGKIQFWVDAFAGTGKYVQSDNNLSTDKWYHIACTFDNTNGGLMYIDGVAQNSGTAFTGATLSAVDLNKIIRIFGTTSGWIVDAFMSNVQLWNTELSASEVTTLYNNGVPLLTGTQPQAANLKAWYPMNVGNANWLGSDWQIADANSAYPQSFNFDGSDDYITTPSFTTSGDDLTISFWGKLPNLTSGSGYILSGNANNQIYYNSSEVMYAKINGSTAYIVTNSGGVPNVFNSDWHHFAITKSGSTLTFWFDGNSYTSSGSATTGGFTLSHIGAYITPSGWINGELSNVAIWNSDQSSEISNIYNNGTPATSYTNTLTAWYKLDNSATFSTNWSIPDASGNGNTGTSSGMTESNLVNNNVSVLNGTSVSMTTANLINSDLTRSIPYSSYSMDFGGTDEYLDSSTAASGIQSATTGTISMWVQPTDATPSAIDTLISISDTSTANTYFNVGILTTGEVYAELRTSTFQWELSTDAAAFSDGSWGHLAITQNGTEPEIYINGIKVAQTFTTTTDKTKWWDDYTVNSINFARSLTQWGAANYYIGKISNIGIWTSALTQDQILTIFNGGVPNSISSLSPVNWWSLAEDSYYDGTDWKCPDLGSGNNIATTDNMESTDLIGDGPGSSANGTATNMDLPTNLEGNAPNSSNNAFSVNMDTADRVASVPS